MDRSNLPPFSFILQLFLLPRPSLICYGSFQVSLPGRCFASVTAGFKFDDPAVALHPLRQVSSLLGYLPTFEPLTFYRFRV